MPTEDLSWLKNKFLLLDTNILIDSVKYPDEFKTFFDLVNSNEVKSVVDYTITFEFLRYANSTKESKDYNLFLDKIFGAKKNQIALLPRPEIFKIAENIALIANRTDNNKIGLADCLIGAQLAKYTDGLLFLATQNHSDFPVCIYDLLYKHDMRLTNGKIKVVGIYQLNRNKYKELAKELLLDSDPFKENLQV